MKRLFILSTLIFLSACGKNYENVRIKSSAIVGGTEVDSKLVDTRFLVYLPDSCAGSIIAPEWILTAAHCGESFKHAIAGVTDLYDKKKIRLKVKDVFIHPQFKSRRNAASYDFALIQLKEAINFEQSGLRSIKLADKSFEEAGGLAVGTAVTAFGWGSTREGGSTVDLLRQVDLKIMDFDTANVAYKGILNEAMFAAGDEFGKKDTCNGDSGGPLVSINSETKDMTLLGVVSFGDVCADKKHPGIYAKVPYAIEWIMEKIK